MRKLKILFSTLGILGLAVFPAAGAMLQLGASLTQLERMHGAVAARPVDLELIAHYEVDPSTNEASVRVSPMRVRRD